MEPNQGDPSKIASPLSIRRETMQLPDLKPSRIITENRDYREPKVSAKKTFNNHERTT